MSPVLAAVGAMIYISAQGLIECPDSLPKAENTPAFQAAVWKLPKHACVSHSSTGAYIVTIYGVQRATAE
jgi:hypothetical protein